MEGVCTKNLLKIEWNLSSHLSKCVGLSNALQSLQFPPRRTGSTTSHNLGEGGNYKYRNMEHYSRPALQCNIRCLVLGRVQSCQKLDGVGPVDNRPSTD